MTRMLERNYAEIKKMVVPTILNDLVCMEITASAKWFLAESDKEVWNLREDFPCVMPPAPMTWLEFDLPPVIRSSVREQPNHGGRSLAALIITLEIEEEDREVFLASDGLIRGFSHYLKQSGNNDGTVVMFDKRQEWVQEAIDQQHEARWVMFWQIFGEPINHRTIIPYINYGFYLDQNGQLLKNLHIANLRVKKDAPEEIMRAAFTDALAFLFALSLTHCRNVEIVENDLPPAVRKKREKKGIPVIKFKSLVIKPMGKQKAAKEGDKPHQPSMRPLHFVRAHFRTYTEDAPLLGRHVGRYFFHMHTRGKTQHGQIEKSYKVEPQKKENLSP